MCRKYCFAPIWGFCTRTCRSQDPESKQAFRHQSVTRSRPRKSHLRGLSKYICKTGAVSDWINFLFMHRTCTLVQEVGEQAAHDGLMTDDQHIALALQLHDDWFQALNQVLVGLKRGETDS